MIELVGVLLVAVGVLLVLQTLPRARAAPVLMRAWQRARGRPNLRARVSDYWRERMRAVLRQAGYPQGWNETRLMRLSASLAAIGVLVGALYLVQGGEAHTAIGISVLGALLGWYAPFAFGRLMAGRAKVEEIEESIHLLQTLEVYLQAGHTLRAALEVAADVLPHLGVRIRQALLVWGQGPYRALDLLAAEHSDESVRLVIAALKQAVDLGQGQLPVFLQREQEAISKAREALAKTQQARKPLIYTLYLALPLAAYMIAYAMPFGITTASAITHITGAP